MYAICEAQNKCVPKLPEFYWRKIRVKVGHEGGRCGATTGQWAIQARFPHVLLLVAAFVRVRQGSADLPRARMERRYVSMWYILRTDG